MWYDYRAVNLIVIQSKNDHVIKDTDLSEGGVQQPH